MKFVLGIVIFIALFLAFIYVTQRSLIYLPDKRRPLLKEWGMSDMQEISLKTSDGLSLVSWYKPACDDKPTMLFFQGNAGNLGLRGQLIRPYLEKGYGVLLLGYRGYGGNPGVPTENNLYMDMWAAWNFLIGQGIPAECIILLGESLGSGLAVELASQRQVGAVILVSPYTSLIDLGNYHYPFLPVKLMLKDQFDSLRKISSVKSPILILLAEEDSIVPAKFSKKLYDAANQPKELVVFHDVDHNSLFQITQEKVINFLVKHQTCKSRNVGEKCL